MQLMPKKNILLFSILALVFLNLKIQAVSFNDFINKLSSISSEQRKTAVKEFLDEKKKTPVIESDSILTFIWYGKAESVLITGNLQNGWASRDTLNKISCGDENIFYRSFIVPSDSRFNYVFIVDGQYRLDLLNPATVPSVNGIQSEAAMPEFKFNHVLNYKPETPHGTLDSLNFISKDDSIKTRQLKIYLPYGYKNLSDLPVVYVLDGNEALNLANYKNVLDNIIADKKIPPVIAVFIPSVQRMEELIGPKRKNMTAAICNELVPVIDSLYKTARVPAKRAIMSTSYGGNLALATVIERNDVFLNVSAQSIIEGELYNLLASESENKSFPQDLKVYLDYGIYEYNGPQGNLLNSIKFFSGCLNSYNIKHTFAENHDGHEWAAWRQNTDRILMFFWGNLNF